MKHMNKRMATVMLVLAMIVSCISVYAEGDSSCPAARSQTVAELLKVLDFKFFVKEEGIGSGSAPVYTAPSEDSIRLADGKASCSVETEIAVAGHVDGWLMVRYEIGKKDEKDRQARVGYIPPNYSKKYQSGMGKIEFNAIRVKLASDAEITDNPRHNHKAYGALGAGTEITILGKYTYTGNWWYIETELDGRQTRGFIDRGTTELLIDGEVYHGNEELGYPAVSPMNTEQTGMVTINGSEETAMIVRGRAGTDSSMVARVYGQESFPCYYTETLSNGKQWYYIWVDGVWGWFSAGASTFSEGK